MVAYTTAKRAVQSLVTTYHLKGGQQPPAEEGDLKKLLRLTASHRIRSVISLLALRAGGEHRSRAFQILARCASTIIHSKSSRGNVHQQASTCAAGQHKTVLWRQAVQRQHLGN